MTDKTKITIRDLPGDERPRERLLSQGASALSNTELIAVILRTGTRDENAVQLAGRILARHGGLHGLARVTASQLLQVHGLGEAKVAQILAALEIGGRAASVSEDTQPLIQRAADAVRLLGDMRTLPQEQLRVLLLDSSGRLMSKHTVYMGTVNASVLRVAEIYREAVVRNAPAIIVAHNHPSGDPTPSPEDIDVTRTLAAAGRLLDIELIDHLIIAQRGWTSLKESGVESGF